jgi:hypothetical protein
MNLIEALSKLEAATRRAEAAEAQLARQAAMSELMANRLAKMVGKLRLFKGTLEDRRNRGIHVFVNKLQNYLQAGHVSDDVEKILVTYLVKATGIA